jgi:hypothetical protein
MLSLRENSSPPLCYHAGLFMTVVPHAGMGTEKSEEPRPWVEELGTYMQLGHVRRWGIPGSINVVRVMAWLTNPHPTKPRVSPFVALASPT